MSFHSSLQIVSLAYAGAEPDAVVVEKYHAVVASVAMSGTLGSINVASLAIPDQGHAASSADSVNKLMIPIIEHLTILLHNVCHPPWVPREKIRIFLI